MLRRRESRSAPPTTVAPAFADFHEWVLSLPWVVERPYSVGTPGVRCFAVECEPLARHQLWLITGIQRQLDMAGIGLAVIIPKTVANELEAADRAQVLAPMAGRNVLVTLHGAAMGSRQDLEAVVLTAYGCALA